MIDTVQLDVKVIKRHDTPKLLVEWSSPWREFVTSIRPALLRSDRRLAGEAPFGLIPLRIMVPSYVAEAFLILAAIFVPAKIAQLQHFVAPRLSSHDVIYYSGEELPRTQDLGGAEAGISGRAGGGEAHHRTQTIRIARGNSVVPKVVDAPDLKLHASRDAVANLLAIRPNPGPPPADGLRSTRTAPNLATNLVVPAPNVIRDYTRNGVQLDSIVAPAPSITRDRTVTAPNFSATVIPPAPSVARDHTLVAPALRPSVIPPAPGVSRDHVLVAPALSPSLVAPAPAIARDRLRATPAVSANVIQAAPGSVSRDFSSAPMQMNDPFVPPPVSTPERSSTRTGKLNLPAPSVVAPPPSAEVTEELRRRTSAGLPESSQSIVPPPPTQTPNSSFVSSLIGKIFGASEVVAPPPAVRETRSNNAPAVLAANVVAPPPSVSATASGSARGLRNGMGSQLGNNVVEPPPSIGISGGTGSRSASAFTAPVIGMPNVVAPPPSLSGTSTSGNPGAGPGSLRGTTLTANIVPPPPSVSGGKSVGPGTGRSGLGLGAPLDAGAALASASSGGSNNAGAVISSQPGAKVGLPANGGIGSLSLSPSGSDKPGIGGTGNGTSIGRGDGSGSGMTGTGIGAAKAGTGKGSDLNAHAGISPTSGPGGAGNAPAGNPPVRGVDISGGTGIVTIPGFGSDANGGDPQGPGRTANKQRQMLGVTIVATATSGGAFEPYKNLLRGEKYTTYLDTSLGTVAMEFADAAATGHPFGGTLTAPVAIRTNLPDGLPRARMVVACVLDVTGNIKNVRVLEAGPAQMTAKVLAALSGWKFQPAMRGNQAIEVTGILGFGIDTNDRF